MTDLKEFEVWLSIRGLSPRTIRVYKDCIKDYLALEENITSYIYQSITLSGSYRNLRKMALKSYLKFLGALETVDPELLKPERYRVTNQPTIPRDEIARIIKENRPHHRAKNYKAYRNYCMISIFAYCGIRPLEMANIQIKHIASGPETIEIQGIKREDNRLIYPPTKEFWYIMRLMELGAGIYSGPDSQLFPLDSSNIGKLVKDLTGYSPRIYRTTFGTEIARQTKDPYMVKMLMGHVNIESTMTYVKLAEDYGKEIKEIKLYV